MAHESDYGPFSYSALPSRPDFRFSNGASLAVWIIPNIEFFPLRGIVPSAVGAGVNRPDVPSWGIRDYGNRVGIFRIFDVMDEYSVRGTAAINSDICLHHPLIIEECLKRGWELIGHNENNTVRLNAVEPAEEGPLIGRTLEVIAAKAGRRPRGWLGAGLQETWQTLTHLCDQGVEYVADWCNDDQPFQMRLADGRPLACVPYSMDTNDKAAYDVLRYSPDEFRRMVVQQFDVLHRESARQARVLALALHPYLSGVPHRIDAVRGILDHLCRRDDVWFATGSELAAEARPL